MLIEEFNVVLPCEVFCREFEGEKLVRYGILGNPSKEWRVGRLREPGSELG